MARIVHGSDFPVPVSGRWAGWRGLLPPDTVRAAAAIANPLELDYQLKLAMGFEPGVFTRYVGICCAWVKVWQWWIGVGGNPRLVRRVATHEKMTYRLAVLAGDGIGPK